MAAELAPTAAETASGRETERDRARDVVNEINRQTLQLQLSAAKHEQARRQPAAMTPTRTFAAGRWPTCWNAKPPQRTRSPS